MYLCAEYMRKWEWKSNLLWKIAIWALTSPKKREKSFEMPTKRLSVSCHILVYWLTSLLENFCWNYTHMLQSVHCSKCCLHMLFIWPKVPSFLFVFSSPLFSVFFYFIFFYFFHSLSDRQHFNHAICYYLHDLTTFLEFFFFPCLKKMVVNIGFGELRFCTMSGEKKNRFVFFTRSFTYRIQYFSSSHLSFH